MAEEKKQKIYDYILKNQYKGKEKRIEHKEKLKEIKKKQEDLQNQKQCPYCRVPLILRKGKYGDFYGCSGYKDGCKFSVNISICQRVISIANLKELTENGRTPVISGFVSAKTGKRFDAALKLENGRAVFDFEKSKPTAALRPDLPIWNGEAPPLPEPPDL